MHSTCSAIRDYTRQIDEEFGSLCSPSCPADDGVINDIINRIYNCTEETRRQLCMSPGGSTDDRVLEKSIDEIDSHLADARSVFRGAFGCSQAQQCDLGSIDAEEPSSNRADATIQCAASSSSGNPGVIDASTSLKPADTQASVGPVSSLQGSYDRVLSFVSECSRGMRRELNHVSVYCIMLEDCVAKTQKMLTLSYTMETGCDTRLERLQKSAKELQRECGIICGAIDESIRSAEASRVRARIEQVHLLEL
ncbi:hypothetical protein PAPHI01_0123 [Pancytospora philotis]|nr:hypothetical protein PAPHI01_0123 [Pancytospora philotis]